MAGSNSNLKVPLGTNSKIRSRSNTRSNQAQSEHQSSSSPSLSPSTSMESSSPSPSLQTDTNENNNFNPGHSRKTSSLSLQSKTMTNHRRTQSFLSQKASQKMNQSRNKSIDSTIYSSSKNLTINTNVDNINSGISNKKNTMNSLSPTPQKGKFSPENSPTSSNISLASPVKVSGIAAGPDTTNLILEINNDFDIDQFIHNENAKSSKPILSSKSFKHSTLSSGKTELMNNTATTSSNTDNNTDEELNDNFAKKNQNSLDFSSPKSLFKTLKYHFPNLNITIFSILSWYIFSMGISVYNRWMFSSENLDFKFPILITSFHQFILTLLAIMMLIFFPRFRLSNTNYQSITNQVTDSSESDESDDQLENEKVTYKMPIMEYITKILPCSVASAGDIGLGNTSFRFITLSLYTMVKTSSLIFVLMWGVFFKLEKLSLRILSIVFIMTFGVSMMVWGQNDQNVNKNTIVDQSKDLKNSFVQFSDTATESDSKAFVLIKRILNQVRDSNELKGSHLVFIGVSLVLISACMSGLRWALTQIMLKKNKRTKNPILTMLYISPGMCVVLFFVGIGVEGLKNFLNSEIWVVKGTGMTIILILIPGFLAFFMTIAEYVLLQYASLLTLSIAGIFKELLTIFISWVVFGDQLSFINVIGLIITFADIVWYNFYRFEQNANKLKNDANLTVDNLDNEFVDIELNNMLK